ncbi:MAG: hydroxyacid dehydrogenase [Bacteroidia bacterium]|nr:hydroxyacid dehydrogenase [Bacteroidia bacterium]
MAKILFIDSNHSALHEALEAAGFTCDLQYTWDRKKILQELPAYEGIVIRSRIKIDRELIDHAANLKFIARAGAGMENIDTVYAESKGIRCLNSPEGNRDAVGEHTLGMLLALLNNITKADRELKQGLWLREENRGTEICGKTIGIIGYGNMGSAFAQRLAGFGATVLAYDKYKKNFSDRWVKEASPEQLFDTADIISLHLPLTDETRYLVNREYIQKFKKNIYIVNTSRGEVVKTDELVEQLKKGKVSGACLDVLEYESPSFEQLNPEQMPEPMRYLLQSDRVLLTPHIAGWSYESHEKIAKVLAGKIRVLYGLE